MNLFLTSSGFQNFETGKLREELANLFLESISKQRNTKVCLIHTIRTQDDWKWLDLYDKELHILNLSYETVNISEDTDLSHISGYGIYYVCGGNTFYILDRLRKTKLDIVLLSEIQKGKCYIGVSAGSIIAGPDIEVSGIGEIPDENDIHLSDLASFGWVPFDIFPHYTKNDRQHIDEFFNKRQESIVAITDDQMVMVTDSNIRVIGKSGGFSIGDHVPTH